MSQDKPIITSRLQQEWYFVTLAFFAWKRWRNVQVRSQFTNRSKHIDLPRRIDIGRLREEIAHVESLTYGADEITWLRDNYGAAKPDGFLTDEFLAWFATSRLSGIDIELVESATGPRLRIEPHGAWCEMMSWETFVLPIVTYLNSEWVLRDLGVTREAAHAEALFRHGMKIERLRQHPDLRFGSFGLRRQLDHDLSRKLDERTIREIPGQLAGISCVWLAKELGWPVIGTYPHLAPMVYSALCGATDAEIRGSHMQFFDDWAETFPIRWRTAVMDTFGSDSFYQDFTPERADRCNVYKVDSGNPFHEGDRLEAWLKEHGRDPRTKVLNPTDGLDTDTMIALHIVFRNRFKAMVPGIGTHYSNDTGFPTFGSFVVKGIEANGRQLVKLSNNISKASGDPAVVEAFKRIHGYTNAEAVECVV